TYEQALVVTAAPAMKTASPTQFCTLLTLQIRMFHRRAARISTALKDGGGQSMDELTTISWGETFFPTSDTMEVNEGENSVLRQLKSDPRATGGLASNGRVATKQKGIDGGSVEAPSGDGASASAALAPAACAAA
ncbi:unnamed protein product, partial [Prorocentrum cordatum]